MYKKIIYHKSLETVNIQSNKGKNIIKNLFNYINSKPNKYINKTFFLNEEKERVVADFIAGMTDRYAINLYEKIK